MKSIIVRPVEKGKYAVVVDGEIPPNFEQLIAAAPELLEALKECIHQLERLPMRDPNGDVCGDMVPPLARLATSKAEGKAVQS